MSKSIRKTSANRPARKAPTRSSRPPRRKKREKKTAHASVALRLPLTTPEKAKAAKRKFERGVIARGEAVPKGQSLPPGATHEVVGLDAEGEPILKRRRFSLR